MNYNYSLVWDLKKEICIPERLNFSRAGLGGSMRRWPFKKPLVKDQLCSHGNVRMLGVPYFCLTLAVTTVWASDKFSPCLVLFVGEPLWFVYFCPAQEGHGDFCGRWGFPLVSSFRVLCGEVTPVVGRFCQRGEPRMTLFGQKRASLLLGLFACSFVKGSHLSIF